MTSAPLHPSPASVANDGWRPPRGKVGVACLIGTESAFFAGFVVAYLFYIGQSRNGPQPWEVLELPPVLVNSAALLSSSITVVLALKALAKAAMVAFNLWLTATILLGGYFLWGTGVEWAGLIGDHHLTIGTNLFGTTFYSLVGFHAFHVVVGLTLLSLVLVLSLTGHLRPGRDHGRVDLLSWYWHFVDAVWVVVFVTVYVVGRQAPAGGAG